MFEEKRRKIKTNNDGLTLIAQSSTEILLTQLSRAAAWLGLSLPVSQQNMLLEYLFELKKWNQTYNLTAVKTIDEMLIQHVFDCLALIPVLQAYERDFGHSFQLIADVGSGAGLPAVVVAVARPTTLVISIDSVQKKTSFVQHTANKLGLVNLEARHSRVEKIKDIKADLVISRAFASLSDFVEISEGITKNTSVMAAMKSRQLKTEIASFARNRSDWNVHCVNEVGVPEMQATRYIAWLRRKNDE